MWICSKCRETQEDTFDACWKCGTTKSGEVDPEFSRDGVPAPVSVPTSPTLDCLRCQTSLQHVGTKRFHEGANWGVLGELGELFVKREQFDVYACPRCGHVEFFVDGVGEAHRPPEPES